MSDLLSLSSPFLIEPGHYSWEVPDGWQQGRGAFGGLVLAALVRTLEHALADPARPMRTLTATLCGPVDVGPARVEVELLRGGSGLTALAARLVQRGEVRTHTVGLFGGDRVRDGAWCDVKAPPMPDWRALPAAAIVPPLAPVFAPAFEFRPTVGLPYASGAEAVTEGWIRARHPGPARDAAFLAAHADAWWPAMLTTLSAPRPAATVSYSLEIVGDFEGLDADVPLYHTGRSPIAAGGYAVEFRELWGADGRLLALNQQTFAIIR